MTLQSREEVARLLRKWEFRNDRSNSEERPKSFWKTLTRHWMRFAKTLGRVNAIFLLTVVYFLVIGPGSLLLKLFGKDLLDRQSEKRDSYWYDKTPEAHDLEHSKHQF